MIYVILCTTYIHWYDKPLIKYETLTNSSLMIFMLAIKYSCFTHERSSLFKTQRIKEIKERFEHACYILIYDQNEIKRPYREVQRFPKNMDMLSITNAMQQEKLADEFYKRYMYV